MMSNSQPQHEQHIIEFYELANALIDERVPQIVDSLLKEKYIDLIVDVVTKINGKQVEISQIREIIYGMIIEELSK